MQRTIKIADYESQLNDLIDRVRAKAVEIADQLLADDETLTPRRAIDRAIPLAEQWYIDRAG